MLFQRLVIVLIWSLLVSLSNAAAPPGMESEDSFLEPRVETPLEEQEELWKTVNNSLLSVEKRAQAERALILARDVRMLETVFSGYIEPIEVVHLPQPGSDGGLRVERVLPLAARMLPFPTTGSLGGDASAPVAVQISYARGRIWSHLSKYAEPEEERHAIYERFFDDVEQLLEDSPEKEWLVRSIETSSRHNWTPKVREHLRSIYQNQKREAFTRYNAGQTLLGMGPSTTSTPFVEYWETREMVIATVWKERGTDFARRMGYRLGGRDDPRVAVLRMDIYDYERTAARPNIGPSRLADLIDSFFGNVSGLYRDRRATMTPEEREQRDELLALLLEAEETGDDTRLREFEAEIEAKRQAELQQRHAELAHRIEKIDEWIAANRERLEAEAAAYTPPEPPARR